MEYFKSIIKKIHISYARYKTSHFKNFISKGDKVLDLGSGRGHIAQTVKDLYDADVTCVDIDDHNNTSLPHHIYDGSNLPFADNTFDTVLIIFVLHHTDSQYRILNEAKRVTKENGHIIILEDTYINRVQYYFALFADYILNAPKGINTPFNFRKESEWILLFRKLGLEVKFSDIVDLGFLDFVRHPLFVLKK